MRKDVALETNGNVKSFNIGIYGDIDKNKENIKLSYLGKEIFNYNNFNELLKSEENNKTLGLDISALDMISPLPIFTFGENIVVKKLPDLIQNSNTVNGNYEILGLDEADKENFLSELATVCNVEKSTFTDNLSGFIIDSGLKGTLLLIIFLSHTLVFISVLCYITIKRLNILGKLMLLGWSKLSFAINTHLKTIIIAIISIFLNLLYAVFLTNNFFDSFTFISFMILIGVLNFIITLILVMIVSLSIFIVKPINAIRDRMPKKIYIVVSCFLYILSSIGSTAMAMYIDGPYREIEKNTSISRAWQAVEDVNILKSVSIGNDTSSFTGQSKEFSTDLYNWYKSIEDDKGVFLANTHHITEEILQQYKYSNTYEHIPNVAMWLYNVSPSYLIDREVNIDKSIIDKAKSGKRVYLIPDSIEESQREVIKLWLKEKDTKSLSEDDIQTAFYQNKEFEFIEYSDDIKMFSWSVKNNDIYIENPIILVNTANNMIYTESDSLRAAGLENGYIKMTNQAKQNFLSNEYLSNYNLDDNDIQFASTAKFIEGLQKTLWQTIYLFGMLLIAVTFIVIALLCIILSTYDLANKEMIAVKQFLGYSSFSIYKYIICTISIIFISQLVAVYSYKSKVGIFYTLVIVFLQIILLYRLINNNLIKKVMSVFKS